MKLAIPKDILEIINKFKKANFQIYIVGGAVRDLLMKKEVKDFDFTTDAKPEEILKIFPDGFYDNKFGTVGIPASVSEQVSGDADHSEDLKVYEITTMRKEGNYKDHRHPVEVSWTNKIEEDLGRRDFTINAMAFLPSIILSASEESLDPSSLKGPAPQDDKKGIIDPFNGQKDLKEKLIRAVGDSSKRFQEDALRLMRAIRIATELEFEIEKTTFSSIKENAKLIKEIARERIRDELFKILESGSPYFGIKLLKETGILKLILPEVEKCFGIIQEGPKHDRIYDIGDHSLRTMRETPSLDPIVKFAALLHDIGKAKTFKKDSVGNVTFYNHDIVGADLALNIAKRFNLSKKQTDKLYSLIRWHMFSTDERQTDSAIRRFIKNVGLENLDDMFALRIGDRLGGDTSKPVSWRMEKFKERIKQVLKKPFSINDLKVNGNDVMRILNIKPGPKVGEVLEKLFKEVSDDSSKNTKEYLFSKIKEQA
ncbi:CCA tRNA nucleotidyltransferase [Candidatus Daviesbacteria bacterium]|nr:CCA tRNA nucleotidyltransferase [Candidatus Daviesbacteria bacterium]